MHRIARIGALAALSLAISAPSLAQTSDTTGQRLLEFRFTPTNRVQLALWIERADGTFLRTVRLTEAVAYRGIGNRPGAMLMNSGFRWPYGRRESVLPVWAHRRAAAEGAALFPRVIFQDRRSEGFASRTSADASRDDYFCLSFNASTTRRDALDAVSCASVFSSDKGRYITPDDVSQGYAEPYKDDQGQHVLRPLSLESLYPPRRDVTRCSTSGCDDHPDVALYAEDARRVMPDIDAVTMATPLGGQTQTVRMIAPPDWEPGQYVAWLEVSTEGDYNDAYNDQTYPTPYDPNHIGPHDVEENRTPHPVWDTWSEEFGYPYRGQPSVVYRIPFTLSATGGTFADMELAGYGALDGQDGEIRSMDDGITNDPSLHSGSGADRIMAESTTSRLEVVVVPTNICGQPDAPATCGIDCTASTDCGTGLICGPGDTCMGVCDAAMEPPPVGDLLVRTHPDESLSHMYAELEFTAPEFVRDIGEYQVRFSPHGPITDAESFMRAEEAKEPNLEGTRLLLPTDAPDGELVQADFGILIPQTRYFVGVRAIDVCGQPGPITGAEVVTTEVHFTTVSPCFVATAAHGSPLAAEVGALRRFRDRHLRNQALGRAAVHLYETVGPYAADFIRDREALRALTRTLLTPLVALAEWLD